MYCMWETWLKATGGVYIIVVIIDVIIDTNICYMLLPHLYSLRQSQGATFNV